MFIRSFCDVQAMKCNMGSATPNELITEDALTCSMCWRKEENLPVPALGCVMLGAGTKSPGSQPRPTSFTRGRTDGLALFLAAEYYYYY